MSRNKLITLIVIMALVMTGLIIVQTNSIRQAANIREEQFDQTVRQVLSDVVRRIEDHEAQLILEEELLSAGNGISISANQDMLSRNLPGGVIRQNYSLSFRLSDQSQTIHQQMEMVFSDTIFNHMGTTVLRICRTFFSCTDIYICGGNSTVC